MPREKKTVPVQVRMPPTLVQAAKEKAERIDRPLSDIIRELLTAWVAGKPKASA
jgi:hypothetical protein